MAGSLWRKTDNSWERIRSVWRKTDGGWERIRSAWRKTTSAWERVFGSGIPAPKSDVNLWFIESPYTSSSNKSTTASSSSDAAWQDSKMYVQRGKWENDPVYFEVRIQKKNFSGTWSLIDPPGINSSQFTYLINQDYSDNDFEEIWPTTSADWPSVSLDDIKNKSVFRAKFRVSQSLTPDEVELGELEYHVPSDSGIAPRLKFGFNPFSGVGFYGELVEYEEFSSPGNKVLAVKWRYETSLLPSSEFINLIGKQVLEVVNQNGIRVLGPFEATVQTSNPQFYIFNYTQSMIDSGDNYTIRLYSIANDYYYNSSNSLEQHMSDSTQTRQLATMMWQPSQLPEPLGGASISGVIKEGGTITLNAGNWDEGSCPITQYNYSLEYYDPLFGEYVVANNGTAYIESSATSVSYTIPETHIQDNGTDQIRLAVYAVNCAGVSETANTTADQTVLPFTKTFYKGRSVCNAEQGCYIVEPEYTGETADYAPGDEPEDIITGTINQREKIVWRETIEWAIASAANEDCVVCGLHTITATAGFGGSITPSGEVQVQTFSDQSFTITADTGYNILNVLIDGVSYGSITSYTFTNVTTDHAISVSFSQKTFYCSAREQDGTTNNYTSTTDETSACIACQEGTSGSANYPEPPACQGCTCCPLTNECVPTYTITATAGSGGSISPSGSITVNQGDSQSFTITANSGYQILETLIDGISYGSLTSYNFTNIQSNHSISVTFTQTLYFCTAREADGTTNNYTSTTDETSQCVACNSGTSGSANYPEAPACNGCVCCELSEECVPTFTITASAGTGGTISPSGSIEVQQGNSQSFTITPSSGYSILNVLIDGITYGTISSYTFTNVQSDHTISATFASTTWYCTAREADGTTNNYTSTTDESSTCTSCSQSWYPTAPPCSGCTCCSANINECSCTVTKSCTPWVYTYGAWSAWGACVECEQNRYRPYTATRTCSGTNADCSTYSGVVENTSGNQYDDPQNCCCAVVENCTPWVYTYGEWSACDINNNRSRSWSRTRTCSGTNADCSTYQDVSTTQTGTDTEPCPETWYCTTSVNSNCAGCTNSIETSNISQSGSGYSISCSTSTYPNCQTPCVQWWCKTTTQDGYCALTGPFDTDQSGAGGIFVTVCTTGTSNPYTCQSQPPFFPPHFPPHFPPFFPPHFPPFFPPHFPPFFPPHFPPHFPPFFPPHFPPFFPPFFPPHFPPFFPPFFPPHFPNCLPLGTQAGCECNGFFWVTSTGICAQ